MQKQNIIHITSQTPECVKHENMNDNNSNAKKPKGFRNLPGLQVAHDILISEFSLVEENLLSLLVL
jgi:hypothetical protein